MAEPARKLPDSYDDSPDRNTPAKPKLGVVRGEGQDSGKSRAPLHSVPQPAGGEEHEEEQEHPAGAGSFWKPEGDHATEPPQRHLRALPGGKSGDQDGKSSSSPGGGSSLYNASGDEPSGALGKAKSKLQGVAKNKMMVGMLGGGLGLVVLFIILIVLLGALKLPDVTQNIESYEFAQSAVEFSRTAQSITDEELATEAANDGAFSKIKDQYGKLRDNTWGRFDSYRPSKVIQNLGDNNGLELRFKTSKLTGRQIFVGGSINGNDFDVEPVTGVAKFIPGLNQIVKFQNRVTFLQSDFWPQLMDTMKANEVGPLVRGVVYYKILGETGGRLSGWILSRFANKQGADADAVATQEMYEATEQQGGNAPPADNAKTEELSEADAAAQQQTQQDASDPDVVKQIDAANGDDPKVPPVVDAKLSSGLIGKALAIGDVLYAVFTPICIIYDGSVQQSGPTIDYQMHQQQNASDQLLAEADQQKRGDITGGDGAELSTAVGATNDEIGDISSSVAYQRAYGHQQSTADLLSPEAGADGTYTYSLLNALGVPANSLEGKSADWIAGNLCSVLTNTYVAGGVALVNVIAAIVSFGGSEAGEEAAGQGARIFITRFIEHVTSVQIAKQGIKTISRGLLNRAMRFAFKQGIVAGATYGLSEIAHLVVAARAGQANNGFAQGTDLVNEADSGANINNAELERQEFFGRPLTESEVAAQENGGETALADANRSKSFAERYFALSNPDSLITHVGMALGADAHPGILASMASLASDVLRPMNSFGSLVSSMDGSAAAAPAPNDLNYGNVQFGWTAAENAVIASSGSYKMLENQAVLDASGQEEAIAQKYAICFGYDYSGGSGDLDPSASDSELQPGPDASLGTLLSEQDITRDDNGYVTANQSLCAPDSLSYNSPDSLANDPRSTHTKDLIFRWRLAMKYDNITDQLVNQGTVQND